MPRGLYWGYSRIFRKELQTYVVQGFQNEVGLLSLMLLSSAISLPNELLTCRYGEQRSTNQLQ